MENRKTSYDGRHAGLYDLFYRDKPYQQEAEFVHQCIKQNGFRGAMRILELACGTGNHAFEFEKLGYQVIATDHSPDMLKIAKEKASQKSSAVDFRLLDMMNIDIKDGPFDVVLCLFDSIGYVQTNENISRVLKGVNRHLRNDGLFIFEFWHAPAILRYYDPVRVRRWTTPEGEILRISETNVLHADSICEVTYSVLELKKDGTYVSFEETQHNRFFLIRDMEYWLAGCGLTPKKFYAGFTDNEIITAKTWHVLAIARNCK